MKALTLVLWPVNSKHPMGIQSGHYGNPQGLVVVEGRRVYVYVCNHVRSPVMPSQGMGSWCFTSAPHLVCSAR